MYVSSKQVLVHLHVNSIMSSLTHSFKAFSIHSRLPSFLLKMYEMKVMRSYFAFQLKQMLRYLEVYEHLGLYAQKI